MSSGRLARGLHLGPDRPVWRGDGDRQRPGDHRQRQALDPGPALLRAAVRPAGSARQPAPRRCKTAGCLALPCSCSWPAGSRRRAAGSGQVPAHAGGGNLRTSAPPPPPPQLLLHQQRHRHRHLRRAAGRGRLRRAGHAAQRRPACAARASARAARASALAGEPTRPPPPPVPSASPAPVPAPAPAPRLGALPAPVPGLHALQQGRPPLPAMVIRAVACQLGPGEARLRAIAPLLLPRRACGSTAHPTCWPTPYSHPPPAALSPSSWCATRASRPAPPSPSSAATATGRSRAAAACGWRAARASTEEWSRQSAAHVLPSLPTRLPYPVPLYRCVPSAHLHCPPDLPCFLLLQCARCRESCLGAPQQHARPPPFPPTLSDTPASALF